MRHSLDHGRSDACPLEQFSVAWDTTMQEHVPGEMLARVYSYDMLALPQGGGAAPRPPAEVTRTMPI